MISLMSLAFTIYISWHNFIKFTQCAACRVIHIYKTLLPGQAPAFHLQASATGPYWDLLKQHNADMTCHHVLLQLHLMVELEI